MCECYEKIYFITKITYFLKIFCNSIFLTRKMSIGLVTNIADQFSIKPLNHVPSPIRFYEPIEDFET